MEYKQFGDRFVIRIDKGEEIVSVLQKFCSDVGVKLGSVSGIGAVNKVVIGFFDHEKKEYYQKEFNQKFEILSLSGNVTTMKGESYIHLHITLSDSECKAFGGHLNSAVVSSTCEVIIEKIDGSVDRELSEEIGLNLIEF